MTTTSTIREIVNAHDGSCKPLTDESLLTGVIAYSTARQSGVYLSNGIAIIGENDGRWYGENDRPYAEVCDNEYDEDGELIESTRVGWVIA